MGNLEEKQISLGDLLAILRRRRLVIIGTVFVFVLVATLYCVVATRRYESVGVIELQKDNADSLGLSNMLSGGAESAETGVGSSIDLQTQANILQSDTLALKTINSLDLENTAEFKPHKGLLARLGLSSGNAKNASETGPLEQSPVRRARAIRTFEKNLTVKPVGGTRLIEVHYESSNPKLAADVVNTLTQSLIDYTFQTRYDATNQTSRWLRDQLGDLRKDSESLQSKVVSLERASGVYGLDTTDAQGQTSAYSDVVSRLQQATTALSLAQQNSILKGAIAQAAESGNAEMLSSLAGNSLTGTGTNAVQAVEDLRGQEIAAQTALSQAQATYGPAYSRVVELKAQVASIQRAIKEEIARLKGRAESDYSVAQEAEAGARRQYQAVKAQADKLNDKAIEYAIAKQDAVESRSLYEDLLRRLKEAGVLEGLRSSNLTLVDPGRVPAVPKKPNVPLSIAGALGGGLLIGCYLAFLVHSLDRTVNTVTELEIATGRNVMAALPLVHFRLDDGTSQIVQHTSPQSPFAEAVRTARTALLLSQSEHPPKTILITSSIAGEGKSLFSINLAVALAQHGKKVLLVDVDLRRGTLARRLKLPSKDGLSAMLSGMLSTAVIHTMPEVSDLYVIGPGPVPPNPAELLGSESFRKHLAQWREEYDFVVLDSAPVLPVTDSVAVGRLVDATLLLARAGVVKREQVRRSYTLLAQGSTSNVGIVLNALSGSDPSYYNYYGYYGHRDGDVYPYKDGD